MTVHGETREPRASRAAVLTGGLAAPGRNTTPRGFAIALQAALVTVGAIAIAAWLCLALVHIDDRYRVGHVQGAWMAIAQQANDGVLYPPFSDGTTFGGTRWMPLPILVNAAAARVTGEYLRSGKAVGIALFAVLLTLLFATLRQVGCSMPLTVALVGLLPATNTGVLAGSSIGGDVLPVTLQLGALMAATAALAGGRSTGLLAAGLLAGLAATSKLTGIWALLAVVSWLGVRREWRWMLWFALCAAVTAGVVLAWVQWTSDGRFVRTFVTFTFAGTSGVLSWIRAPSQLMFFGTADALAVWMIAPFAIAGALAASRGSATTIHHHALGWSLLLTLAVFTDVGAGFNQLLDPAVLTLVVTGALSSRLYRSGEGPLATLLIVAVLWAGATGVRQLVPELRVAVERLRSGDVPDRYAARPLDDAITPGEMLLSEDPAVPVLLGRRPVVLDPFMLRRLDEVQPVLVDALIARIADGEFHLVALVNPLHEDDDWWRQYHLGLRVIAALRERYAFDRQADGYYLYRPAPAVAEPTGDRS